MDTIAYMRTFTAVARAQSFTAGAKELGITTKVASNHIRALEQRLGVQLFYRTTRKVSLTDIGTTYFAHCGPLLDQFDAVESITQSQQIDLAGVIRLTAPTGFGSAQLAHALAAFTHKHPNIEIDLHLADHLVNIVEDGFDLALRFGHLEDSTLMARRLLDMRIVVFATPAYLARHGEPQHPNELLSHNCLRQQSTNEPAHWSFQDEHGPLTVRVTGSVRSNSPRAIAHLATQDAGIGRAPLYAVAPFVARGELKLLLEPFKVSVLPLHAVYPQSKHVIARVRRLIDHLAETLDAEASHAIAT